MRKKQLELQLENLELRLKDLKSLDARYRSEGDVPEAEVANTFESWFADTMSLIDVTCIMLDGSVAASNSSECFTSSDLEFLLEYSEKLSTLLSCGNDVSHASGIELHRIYKDGVEPHVYANTLITNAKDVLQDAYEAVDSIRILESMAYEQGNYEFLLSEVNDSYDAMLDDLLFVEQEFKKVLLISDSYIQGYVGLSHTPQEVSYFETPENPVEICYNMKAYIDYVLHSPEYEEMRNVARASGDCAC